MGSENTQGSGIRRRMRVGTRLSCMAAGVLLAAIAVTATGCSAAGASDTAERPAAVDGGVGGAEGPAAEGDAAATEEDRAIVVEGSMSIDVDDVTGAATAAVDLASAAGGRVDAREEQGSGDGEGSATLTLRLPADDFDAVVEDLRGLGEVGRLSTSSTDVTDAVVDVDARIAALEQTIGRLQGFQQAAGDVADLIDLESELRSRQGELEQLRAEQASLADRVAWSTLHLELYTERTAPAQSLLPENFGTAVAEGWQGMVGFFAGLSVILGLLLPWILLAAVITGVVLVVVRVVRTRREKRTAESSGAPTPPPAGPEAPGSGGPGPSGPGGGAPLPGGPAHLSSTDPALVRRGRS